MYTEIHDYGNTTLPAKPQNVVILQIEQLPDTEYRNKLLALVKKTIEEELCDWLILPEYSTDEVITEKIITIMEKQNRDMIVIAGSYQRQNKNMSPVLIKIGSKKIMPVYQEKLSLTDNEIKQGIMQGSCRNIFVNTGMGDFAVLICLEAYGDQHFDYLKKFVDVIVVIACNGANETFHDYFEKECSNTYSFILYANQATVITDKGIVKGGESAVYVPFSYRKARRYAHPKDNLLQTVLNIGILEIGRKGQKPGYPHSAGAPLAIPPNHIKCRYKNRKRKFWVLLKKEKEEKEKKTSKQLLQLKQIDNNSNNVSEIKELPFLIGRNRANDLPLPGKSISDYHAEIVFRDNNIYLHDLDSRYGTFFQDESDPIDWHSLHSGDQFSLAGQYSFEFHMQPFSTENTKSSPTMPTEMTDNSFLLSSENDLEYSAVYQTNVLGKIEILDNKPGSVGIYEILAHGRNKYALKTLETRKADNNCFANEGHVWLTLGYHPYIVNLHHIEHIKNVPRLFLEYIPDDNLRQHIRYFQSQEACKYALQIAYALQHLHAQDIVHCDIKPENIMVDLRNNLAKITDFSHARKKNEKSGGGTEKYMAPERLGRRKRIIYKSDPASDIYSYGLILFEMFTGFYPYDIPQKRSREEWLRIHLGKSRDFPKERYIPSTAKKLIDNCLEKQARMRPQIETIIEELQAVFRCDTFSDFCSEIDCSLLKEMQQAKREFFTPASYHATAEETYLRGLSFYNLDFFEEAVEHYTIAIRKDANLAKAYINRGVTYIKIKEDAATLDVSYYEKAFEDYCKAQQLEPLNIRIYEEKFWVYKKTEQWQEAILECEQIIRLDSENIQAYLNRATIYKLIGESVLAIKDYNTILDRTPDNITALLNRGFLYREQNNFAKANSDFFHIIGLPSSLLEDKDIKAQALAYLHLGKWAEKQNQLSHALKYYEKGAELDSNCLELHKKLTNFYIDLKNWEKALIHCNEWIDIEKEYEDVSPTLYLKQSELHIKLGYIKKAKQDFDDALFRNPDCLEIYEKLTIFYTNLEEWDKALINCSIWIQLDSNNAIPYRKRSELYRKIEDIEKAEKDAAIAHELGLSL